MTTLTIQLSTSSPERVSHAIVEKLYQTALTSKVENVNNELTMTLEGNIISNHAYLDAVTYLRTKFPNLTITIEDNAYYIRFVDSTVVQNLLSEGIGDGEGITQSNASTARFGDLFKDNTSITSFPEFKYFSRENTNPLMERMFSGCSNLATIDLSECTIIKDDQFKGTALTTVSMPNLQTISGNELFRNCVQLLTVTNLGTISSIPFAMFLGCTSLTSVVFPSGGITQFKDSCFRNCSNLSLSASNIANATVIELYAFSQVNLTGNVSLSLTELGPYAFTDTNITGLDLSTSTFTDLKSGIVNHCRNLTSISLPSTVVGKLPNEVFNQCNSLQTIDLSNTGLTMLSGTATFSNCTSLRTLVFPSTLTTINNSENFSEMFRDCRLLEEIDFSNINQVTGSGKGRTNSMFRNCSSLKTLHTTTLYFSDLGIAIFSGCSNLEGELNFPNVTSAAASDYGRQFLNCTKLTKITLPSLISDLTFGSAYESGTRGLAPRCTSLKILDIGLVSKIGSHNFTGGTKLSAVILHSTTPPTIVNGSSWEVIFSANNTILYVPLSALDTYKSDSWFSLYGYENGVWKIKTIENDYNEASILGN